MKRLPVFLPALISLTICVPAIAQHEIGAGLIVGGAWDTECSEPDVECPTGKGIVFDYARSIVASGNLFVTAQVVGLWASFEDGSDTRTLSYAAGVRARRNGRIGAWAHVLIGLIHARLDDSFFGKLTTQGVVLIPGAGLDATLSERASIRLRLEAPLREESRAWRAGVSLVVVPDWGS